MCLPLGGPFPALISWARTNPDHLDFKKHKEKLCGKSPESMLTHKAPASSLIYIPTAPSPCQLTSLYLCLSPYPRLRPLIQQREQWRAFSSSAVWPPALAGAATEH